MKLLCQVPSTVEVSQAESTSLIKNIPLKRVVTDKVTDSETGTGSWFDGRVLFISNEEVVEIPARCRATSLYGASSRMVRTARQGLPKKPRSGAAKRIHTVLVETTERKK